MQVDPARLDIELQKETGPYGDVSIVVCRGELDAATAPGLRDVLAGIEEDDVLVDLCDTTFVDSTGLSTLLNALRRLTREERRLVVVCPSGAVRRTLRLTHLVDTLRVAEDRPGALRSLAR